MLQVDRHKRVNIYQGEVIQSPSHILLVQHDHGENQGHICVRTQFHKTELVFVDDMLGRISLVVVLAELHDEAVWEQAILLLIRPSGVPASPVLSGERFIDPFIDGQQVPVRFQIEAEIPGGGTMLRNVAEIDAIRSGLNEVRLDGQQADSEISEYYYPGLAADRVGKDCYSFDGLTTGEDYTLATHINNDQYVVRITYLNDAASASQPAAETQSTV